MRQRSNNFCTGRHGTTLIEVIAGLVILGTLLSSLLIRATVSCGKRRRQSDSLPRSTRWMPWSPNGWTARPAPFPHKEMDHFRIRRIRFGIRI